MLHPVDPLSRTRLTSFNGDSGMNECLVHFFEIDAVKIHVDRPISTQETTVQIYVIGDGAFWVESVLARLETFPVKLGQGSEK